MTGLKKSFGVLLVMGLICGGCGGSSSSGDSAPALDQITGYWYLEDEDGDMITYIGQSGQYRVVQGDGSLSIGIYSYEDGKITTKNIVNNFSLLSPYRWDKTDVDVSVDEYSLVFADVPEDVWQRINAEPEDFSVSKGLGWEGAYNRGNTLLRTVTVHNQSWGGNVLPCFDEIQGGDCTYGYYRTYLWYDDGTNGDVEANDGVYTIQFDVGNEETCTLSGEIWFVSPAAVLSNGLSYNYTFL